MKRKVKSADLFCPTCEWQIHAHKDIRKLTEPQILAMSRRGMAPPYYRTLSERSPAMWRKSDITAWAAIFSPIHPEFLTNLLSAGFPKPTVPVSTHPVPRKRRPRCAAQ